MGKIWSNCSRGVFRASKRIEKAVDWLTGAAGPTLVALAAILISLCAVTFFDVVYPAQFLSPDTLHLYAFVGTAWCFYVVYMVLWLYYKAITIRPGTPLDKLSTPPKRSWRSLVPKALCVGPLRGLPLSTAARGVAALKKEGRDGMDRSTQEMETRERKRERELADGESAGEASAGFPSCKKCVVTVQGRKPPKPERTHHCSVCRHCVLKYDHHCPWINQCVGLHNERYFLLFLCYLSMACGFVAFWGWEPLWISAFDFTVVWSDTHVTPRACMLLLWILTAVFAFALGVMALFQILLIIKAETAVEKHDNAFYAKLAKVRGRTYRNPYDLGRLANLACFFNVKPEGEYHWTSIFLPFEIPPSSDGWNFRKADGWQEFAMGREDELTDEESEGDGNDDGNEE